MLEPREKTSRLSSNDGHRDSSSQVVKKKTLFRRRHRPALQQGNVLRFGDGQLLDQVVKVLGNISVLAGHKAKNVTEPQQALLQGTHLPSFCAIVFGVDLSQLISVGVWYLFGSLVDRFLIGIVPAQTSADAF